MTPYGGAKVKSYRSVYDKDGNLLCKSFEASSDYKVRNKVILKGPAAAEPQVPAAGNDGPAAPTTPTTPTAPVTPPETEPTEPVSPPVQEPETPEEPSIIVVAPEEPEP